MTATPDIQPQTTDYIGWIGRLGAPIAAIVVYLLLGNSTISDPGRATAAIGVLMAVLWMTEALPLPATSLLPVALFPLAGVLPIGDATAPYADQNIFLFMGGFMLALGMEKWGLHQRIALLIVLLVGTKPRSLVGGFMIASATLSMWISNSATAVMMMPLGMSVIGLVETRLRSDSARTEDMQPIIDRFAVCLMLGLAYAASIGGVATIIGTPPNVFLVSYLEKTFDVRIGFAQWMLFGVPFSATFLLLAWIVLTFLIYPIRLDRVPGGRELIRQRLRDLGPVTRGERTVFTVFMITASLWVFREPLTHWAWLADHAPFLTKLTDAGVAIIGAMLLFVIPVHPKRGVFALDWNTAVKLPWGVLLLFGGGLSLARAVTSSGLDSWIGSQAQGLETMPTVVIVAAVVLMVVFLTELASNTATAATFVPILGGVAIGIGADVPTLVIPAAIAASCGFMMPVGTPPNAIVFGTGRVRIGQMMWAGVWLNLIGVALITLFTFTVVRWTLKF